MTNFSQPVYFNSDILSSERQLWLKLPLLHSLSTAGTLPSRALIPMSINFSWPHLLLLTAILPKSVIGPGTQLLGLRKCPSENEF